MNRKRHAVHDVREPPEMSLFDFYKMMTAGNMGVMLKAMMMIKFQAGLDASTLADRFNFEAYGQIVKHFGIEDYRGVGPWQVPGPDKAGARQDGHGVHHLHRQGCGRCTCRTT